MGEGMQPHGQFLVYRTEDGRTKIDVRLEGETAWLTQAHMAELFQTTVPNVSMHLRNIFEEGELQRDSVVKEYLTTAADAQEKEKEEVSGPLIGFSVKERRTRYSARKS